MQAQKVPLKYRRAISTSIADRGRQRSFEEKDYSSNELNVRDNTLYGRLAPLVKQQQSKKEFNEMPKLTKPLSQQYMLKQSQSNDKRNFIKQRSNRMNLNDSSINQLDSSFQYQIQKLQHEQSYIERLNHNNKKYNEIFNVILNQKNEGNNYKIEKNSQESIQFLPRYRGFNQLAQNIQGEKNNSIEKNNNKLNDSMQLDSYLIRQPVIHKFERNAQDSHKTIHDVQDLKYRQQIQYKQSSKTKETIKYPIDLVRSNTHQLNDTFSALTANFNTFNLNKQYNSNQQDNSDIIRQKPRVMSIKGYNSNIKDKQDNFGSNTIKQTITNQKDFYLKLSSNRKILDESYMSQQKYLIDSIMPMTTTMETYQSINIQPFLPELSQQTMEYVLKYSLRSKMGSDPVNPNKINQDVFVSCLNQGKNKDIHAFAVGDGHGPNGHKVSQWLRKEFKSYFQLQLEEQISVDWVEKLFTHLSHKLLSNEEIDTTVSGSTFVSVFLQNTTLISAGIGDSRVVLVELRESNFTATQLTTDHKPSNPAEAERILRSRGLIAPAHMDGRQMGPLRIWRPNAPVPGLAVTRSFGDSVARTIGLVSQPQTNSLQLERNHRIIVLGTDGVWEFVSNEVVVESLMPYYWKQDLPMACKELMSMLQNTFYSQFTNTIIQQFIGGNRIPIRLMIQHLLFYFCIINECIYYYFFIQLTFGPL